MTTLFDFTSFTSHSGLYLSFKIDCDALTDADLDCLARVYAGPEGHPGGRYFCRVEGIPRGGIRFAEALRRYVDLRENHAYVLIADDVLTTGKSFATWKRHYQNEQYLHGVVIFARGPCPYWITPIFTMSEGLR